MLHGPTHDWRGHTVRSVVVDLIAKLVSSGLPTSHFLL